MSVVRDCMFPDVTTLAPTTTILKAICRVMRQAPGFAVVLDNIKPIGLVTEFDFLRWILAGHDLETVCLGDLSLSTPQMVHEDTPCQSLLRIYNHRRFRRFPVLNDEELLSGGIMEKQILRSLPRSKLMSYYHVTDMVVSAPPMVSPDLTYMEVLHKMVAWHRGCVLVVEGDRLRGMVTEGDLLRFRVGAQWDATIRVGQLPFTPPVTIEADRDLLFAVELFIRSGHRRLPVVAPNLGKGKAGKGKAGQGEAGRVIGLLTQTDVLKQVVDSARSHKAVLNPEDIAEPAIWFEPDGEHRILALNQKGAAVMGLDPHRWVGRPVRDLAVDPAIWHAIGVLLQSSGTIDRITLPLRSGHGGTLCASCRFTLVHTPKGEDRIFWTMEEMENNLDSCP